MGDVPIAGDAAERIGCHKPMANYVNIVQCNVPSDPCITHMCESAVQPQLQLLAGTSKTE